MTKPKLELLEWIGREDVTPLGSCRGLALSELMTDGFVKVTGEAVVLTRKGIATLEAIVATREWPQGGES